MLANCAVELTGATTGLASSQNVLSAELPCKQCEAALAEGAPGAAALTTKASSATEPAIACMGQRGHTKSNSKKTYKNQSLKLAQKRTKQKTRIICGWKKELHSCRKCWERGFFYRLQK
jgi:hypothetical protein